MTEGGRSHVGDRISVLSSAPRLLAESVIKSSQGARLGTIVALGAGLGSVVARAAPR